MSSARHPNVVEILTELIAINSENPGHNEAEIAGYCSRLLMGSGISVETRSRQADRPNVIARLEGRHGRKLVYQAHLDTKPALHAGAHGNDWNTHPFEPIERDGCIFGLGACDTKGGAAAQLAALLELAQEWDSSLPTLEWQGVADEENGSREGCEYLAELDMLGADLAIVAEPTNGVVSTMQLGSVWVDIRILGKQAHGGTPWRAHDAIAAGLQLIDLMKIEVAKRPRNPSVRLHPQVGVRVLEGGGHAGTVAGACRIVSDVRVRPDERRSDYLELWQQCAERVRHEHSVHIDICDAAGGGCQPNVVSDAAILESIADAWVRSTGGDFEPCVFYGGSDARYFAAAGVPALVLGPGDLQHAHAPNEFAPIAEIERCRRFLTGLPRRWRQG